MSNKQSLRRRLLASLPEPCRPMSPELRHLWEASPTPERALSPWDAWLERHTDLGLALLGAGCLLGLGMLAGLALADWSASGALGSMVK